jgi:hypothetical protein
MLHLELCISHATVELAAQLSADMSFKVKNRLPLSCVQHQLLQAHEHKMLAA